MQIINLHLYPSTFKYESRMLKEAGTIVRHGLATQVIILSAGESGQSREEMLSNRIRVHRIVTFLGGRAKFSRILF
jgi:hypothetical protein